MDLGTALGVVSLGLQVLEGVISYYSSYQDYGEDVLALCTSSASLIQTLRFLHGQLERKDSVQNDFHAHILASIYQCHDGLQRLQKKLDKIKTEPAFIEDNFLEGLKRQATNQLRKASYPFKCSTLAKLRETVQNLRDNLALALQAFDLDTAERNTQILARLDLRVDEVIAKLENLNNCVLDDALKRWLSPSSPETYLQSNLKQWSPQSGDWFLQGKAFDNWMQEPGSLWLTGMPGCGKSIMCSAAIALIEQRRASSRPILIAYHFHTFSDSDTRTVGAMLRNLVHQLACQSDDICNTMTDLFKKCGSGSRRPSDSELTDLLKAALSHDAEAYIFLDALDESDEQVELVDLITHLETQALHTHFFTTSRRHAAFVEAIESGNFTEIAMERATVDIDIERYIVDTLAIDFEDPDRGPFDPCYRVKDPMAVLEYCPGLIALQQKRRINAPRWRDKPVVALAHFSVDQYLRPRVHEWRFGETATAHALIARTCLRYLLYFDKPDEYTKTTIHEYPFLHFAAKNFANHLKSSNYDAQAMDLAWHLLTNEKALKTYYTVSQPLAPLLDTNDFAKRKRRKQGLVFTSCTPPPLFLAVLWDLPLLVERLLNDPLYISSINVVLNIGMTDDLAIPRTAIEAAVYNKNFELFVLLHRSGAELGNCER
ncbi:unnamed protein product [Aureobasidium vineae]|uniref:Nephrocystin 3-like N-terminal domain-containing protein n=1 Tax=Aureobasidium vineae TaxID=2773715 RepID=A0A9N8JE78_9PEZI|nr:unnamed protein product [Aureobasidium vineae]